LLLLVDALRPDYVARTQFLKQLAATSSTGVLRECFGFVPRAAYFGGLSAQQLGFTNMFCFDPAQSPFTMAGALPASPIGATFEAQAGIRQLVEQSARDLLGPFAKAYASSAEIPLHYLPCFDLVEKRAPWDKRVGYRSLFAMLDEQNIPWYQCSWPESNRLADHSDEGIVRETLKDLRPEHRFAYVHLQELDGIGHAFGPNSAELQKHLTATDKYCQQLVEALRQRYERFDLALFADHGIVSVTRTLDVSDALESTGLGFGVDYAFFLDSTMARFWFYHARARRQTENALRALSGGRVLGTEDLKAYGIAGCDPRNAELIFLADPGVLIFPNFFQARGDPIKGMHGYDPDCPDNLGFFLLHSSHDRYPSPGKVDPPMLFPLMQRLLGLKGQRNNAGEPEIAVVATAPRFTSHADPKANEIVRQQLGEITHEIDERFGRPTAVVLTGSFGRGEGGVFRDPSGRYRPVNDYDLLVVSDRNPGPALKKLGDELAQKLGIDFIDLGWSDGDWAHLPLSVQHYDLKYGSQVIAGDATVLDRIPAYASADIPIYEAIKLLLNRSAGLLTGLRGEFFAGKEPAIEQRRYLTNQIVKALIAIGDWHLLRWECYDTSYRLRAARLQSLATGAGLPSELVRKIVWAYQFKCLPDYDAPILGLNLTEILTSRPRISSLSPRGTSGERGSLTHTTNGNREQDGPPLPGPLLPRREERETTSQVPSASRGDLLNTIAGFHPDLECALIHSINLHTESHAKTLSQAMTIYVQAMSADANWVAADNAICAVHPEVNPLLRPERCKDQSVRHLVYSVVPFVLGAASEAPPAWQEALSRTASFLQTPAMNTFSPEKWEELRALVVRIWFAICH